MLCSLHGLARVVATAGAVATLALGLASSALGDDWARDRASALVVQEPLDPAIRTAIAARGSDVPAPSAVVASVAASDDGFAWGAAAIGLGVGIAAMCLLIGCVTLVRNDGRLRSA
jgi:hypothetical protein